MNGYWWSSGLGIADEITREPFSVVRIKDVGAERRVEPHSDVGAVSEANAQCLESERIPAQTLISHSIDVDRPRYLDLGFRIDGHVSAFSEEDGRRRPVSGPWDTTAGEGPSFGVTGGDVEILGS